MANNLPFPSNVPTANTICLGWKTKVLVRGRKADSWSRGGGTVRLVVNVESAGERDIECIVTRCVRQFVVVTVDELTGYRQFG